MQQKRER
jgi:hypothetical protein